VEVAEWEDELLFQNWPMTVPVRRTHVPCSSFFTRILTEDEQPDLMIINFVLFRTLPDSKPVVARREHLPMNPIIAFFDVLIYMPEIFSRTAVLEEVLWKCAGFEDKERNTLQENAYFFLDFPRSVDTSPGEPNGLQIKQFELKHNATIYIFLVDQLILVFEEHGQGTQALRDLFRLKLTMISEGLFNVPIFPYAAFDMGHMAPVVHRLIEGESVVGESTRGTPYVSHCKDHFASDCPVRSLPDNPPRFVAAILAGHAAEWTYENRRNPFSRGPGSSNDGRYYAPGGAPSEFMPPPPPTPERPAYCLLLTAADTLNGDVLLQIFDFYRLDDEENWNLQLRWCKLSHVCRKWRYLVLESFFHLNMHIPLTNGTRPFYMLTHLLPLPLVIHYRSGDASEDNRAILHAIQQRDRTLRVVLQALSSILHKLTLPMDESFPRLETLSLLSTTEPKEHADLMLSETFLAPNLRHLSLRCVRLPTALLSHAFAPSLVTLDLMDIQAPGYLGPAHLVIHIRLMPQLEELSIGSTFPVPRPRDEGELLSAPITSVTLPSLKRLKFRGVAAYLESLVARIGVPFLEKFSTTLFNQLAFTVPHLSQFINAKEGLGYRTTKVTFNDDAVLIAIRHPVHPNLGVFDLHISCQQFDWQVDSAGQLCGALHQVFSLAEELELALGSHVPALPSKWQGEVESTVWHDLLLPFNGVKKLCIDPALSSELASALPPDDEGPGSFPLLLPKLGELELEIEIRIAKNPFAPFINARRLPGHSMLVSPSFAIGPPPPLPNIHSERIKRRVFTHSSLSDRRYAFQAPESDPSSDNEE
jgi:F-box-like